MATLATRERRALWLCLPGLPQLRVYKAVPHVLCLSEENIVREKRTILEYL